MESLSWSLLSAHKPFLLSLLQIGSMLWSQLYILCHLLHAFPLYSQAYCYWQHPLLSLQFIDFGTSAVRAYGVQRTALNYRKVKSFAQGHSIRQWQNQTKTLQIPQIRFHPSAVCTNSTLNISFCSFHHSYMYLHNACVLHMISASARTNAMSIIFTV